MPIIELTVSERIRESTLEKHREAEEVLMSILRKIRTREDYNRILECFYGFFQPLQLQIRRYIHPQDLPDIDERRTSDLLLCDLQSLGSGTETLPICHRLPRISNKVQAFGALYVLEGSTLGGRVISKMLAGGSSSYLFKHVLHFFNGYGDKTGSKWKTFIEVLNLQPDEEEMINSARETFTLFKNWLNHLISDDGYSK